MEKRGNQEPSMGPIEQTVSFTGLKKKQRKENDEKVTDINFSKNSGDSQYSRELEDNQVTQEGALMIYQEDNECGNVKEEEDLTEGTPEDEWEDDFEDVEQENCSQDDTPEDHSPISSDPSIESVKATKKHRFDSSSSTGRTVTIKSSPGGRASNCHHKILPRG